MLAKYSFNQSQSQLSSLISKLVQQATATYKPNHAYMTQSVTCLYSGPPPPISMHLRAAAVTSQLAIISDHLSPTSTLDMPPPLLSVVTITQTIQPTYYTTPSLHNLPVTAHSQHL